MVEPGASPAPASGGPGPATSGSVIAGAVGVMNVATYGFTILAARELGPRSYGAFAAVMNVLLVVGVASLALQATAARRIAAAPGDVAAVEDGVRRLAWRASLLLGIVLVALAPVLDAVLRLDSLPTALLIGATAVPLTFYGGQAGILQGERRWRPLALLYLASGVPRLVIGTALVLWRPEESAATLAVFLGALFPVLVGAFALRGGRRHAGSASVPRHQGRALLRESARNSHALLVFFAVSNVDVVIARNVLDPHDAGLYAGGLILAKAVLFLPQFVVVLAFPAMSSADDRRRALRLSLLLVAGLGAVGVLAAWALSGVAIVFVGGTAYAEIQDQLWLFAVLGTLLSMVQLLVYALLARQGGRAVYALWVALAAVVLGAQAAHDVTALVVTVVVVDAVLLVVLLTASLRADADPARTH